MIETVLHDRYRALLQAARNLLGLTSLDDVVEHIIRYSREMMQAEACSMYLPDPETHELIIYSARGSEDTHFHTTRIPWDKGIAGSVFQNKEAVRTDDASKDSRLLRPVAEKAQFVTRALLTIPLINRNECVGVIQAINPTDGGTFSDADQEIFEGLAGIVTSALMRLEREKRALEDARMARELGLAGEIQRSFLAPELMVLPRSELRVRYQPARMIGGDFYTAMALPGDRILVAIGDVSGKGIPAALTTAQVTTEMNALPKVQPGKLKEWVTNLNQSLCGRLAAGRFVATTFLHYDPSANTIEVVCAGQFAPWRYHDDEWEPLHLPKAPPLGIFRDPVFESATIYTKPGEKWLLFSDGITEGRDRNSEEYGTDRLHASLVSASPQLLLQTAWTAWSSFVRSDKLHDDACLAVFATRPPDLLEVSSDPSQCKVVRSFIEDWAELAGYGDLVRGQIVLAMDEAFTNILRHAYKGEAGNRITLSASIDDQSLHLRVRDYGAKVEVENLKGRELHDIKPGGLGMHLLKMTFPQMEYVDCEQGTELRLSRPLPEAVPLQPAA